MQQSSTVNTVEEMVKLEGNMNYTYAQNATSPVQETPPHNPTQSASSGKKRRRKNPNKSIPTKIPEDHDM